MSTTPAGVLGPRRGTTRANGITRGLSGAVTLVSLSLIMSLTIYEFIDYRRVHMVSFARSDEVEERGGSCEDNLRRRDRRPGGGGVDVRADADGTQEPSIIVDKSRGEKLVVNLNVTFPRVPCYR